MRNFVRRYAGPLLIALTLLVVAGVALREGNLSDTYRILRGMQPRWGALAALLWLAFVASRGGTMRFFLGRQGVQVRLCAAFRASLLGLFYSGVTPAASGGQPMQIYQLHKEGVPVSLSASGAILKFVGFQTMLLLLAGTGLGLHYAYVRAVVGSSFFLVVTGFAVNAAVVLTVMMLLINRRAVRCVVRVGLKAGQRLRLVKDRQLAEEKINATVESYLRSLSAIRGRPLDILALCGLSAVQVLLYSLILWATCRAIGVEGGSVWQLVTLQLLLYQTVSFVPLPGASGAQEGVFYLFMHTIVPNSLRLGTLMAWRFFTFYITLLVGGLTVLWEGIRSLRRR